MTGKAVTDLIVMTFRTDQCPVDYRGIEWVCGDDCQCNAGHEEMNVDYGCHSNEKGVFINVEGKNHIAGVNKKLKVELLYIMC